MADFMDFEAEESEEEYEVAGKKHKKIRTIDSEEEEEEDDEDNELKDLIDDRPIDESDDESSDDSESSRKRKKSDDDFDDRLEDEDYDLIEENLGVKVDRKRFKRLKRMQEEESEEEHEDQVEEERDKIANELFDGSDNDEEIISENGGRLDDEGYGDEEEDEYSDEDNFIVNDDDADKRKKRKPIFINAALQEAQDIFGVDFDYDDFDKNDEYEEEEEEDEDYIDDDGVEGEKRTKSKKAARKKSTEKTIFEIYEPTELKRGHFTDLDNKIRNTDIPERMQLRDVPVTAVPEGSNELEDEAEWIYKQAFCKPPISSQDGFSAERRERPKKGPQTIGKIKNALDFMRNQQFEVPFIAFYRKEYVQPELNINDLWKVYKYDEKWCQLRSRKENLIKLFEKMQQYQAEQLMNNPDAPIPDNVRVLKDEDIERLRRAQTPEELKDVQFQFQLYYTHEVPAMQETYRSKENEYKGEPEDLKRALRNGAYAMCIRGGLDGFAKRFGLTPEHFGENLRDNYQRYEVEQEPTEPSEVAKEYISAKFTNVEDIIQAGKFMVAKQISRDPLVRRCVREAYFERAKLNVKPTKKGIKEIDENHPCYSLKYLKDKPVKDLKGDEFLKLSIAQSDELLTVELSEQIDGLLAPNYIDEAKQLYQKDEFSKTVQEWNDLRQEIVELAIKRLLIPDLKKELQITLMSEAKECVLKTCCRKLYNWLKVSPYVTEFPDEDEEEWDTSKGLRVMGVAFVPDYNQAAFTVLIGPDGEYVDHLKLPYILKRKNSFRDEEKAQKEADLAALKSFIYSKKPHVICVGGESREAQMILQDLRDIVAQLVEDDQFPSISVEIVENELSKIYANSVKGETDFRDYPQLLRQAISLARRLQDPLIEFSQLCTTDDEILCLRYHTLQEQISPEELLEALFLEFVNRTNEVGVDVNLAVQQPYTSNLIQFVCGLGPRKAQALIKTLKQNYHRLDNRTQLVTACHMGPKVFINCAGFIKIDTNSLGDSTEAFVEVLDSSRVHPETYEWARKMAVDALEYDDEDANPAGALEEILESPERLIDLDLDAFAEELERQGFGNKSITLYDIRAELNHRYKDLRTQYASPNTEELFNMLTKENPETFFIGKIVLATVVGISHRKPQGEQLDQANPVRNDETGLWQCPFCLKNDFPELSEVWNHFDAGGCPGQAIGVRLRLDNGISGYIHIKNLSDKHVTNIEERVRIGQIIHCRVIKIDVERFSIECSSKSSDLADKNQEWRPPKDRYFDADSEADDLRQEQDTKKQKQLQTYIKRVIDHPSFYNYTFTEAEKLMATMDQGEVVVRPSSKGADHLTVTWKVADGVCQHIDIREKGKENAFTLGKSLWIGSQEFEDLDEIIARYVSPMASHARDILTFKYYRDTTDGLKDKAEEQLKEDKKKNPGKIHYIMCASKNYPGKFILSYQPRTRFQHEYISVTPEGFRLRQHMFDSLGSLFRWFKEHFRDPMPGTPSTPRNQAAARTPFHVQTPSINLANMNPETIQRVAQHLPNHMLHSLSQVANQTPHYPHTPGQAAYAAGGVYPNTPYTPSGQTPFMTPYHTPHTSQTPRYGSQTPSHTANAAAAAAAAQRGQFLHPGMTPTHRTPSHRPSSHQPRAHAEHTNWKKAAEEWAKKANNRDRHQSDIRTTPGDSPGRITPLSGSTGGRHQYSRNGPPMGMGKSPRFPYGRDSVRSTPRTNTSPHSMVESSLDGDATPLCDEN